MGETISILLVDDHLVVRRGLVHVLAETTDLTVVGEAESGEAALYMCSTLKPDIVLMDVQMDGIGGIEATKMLAKHHEASRIIGLSSFANRDSVANMIAAGAKGYLLKDLLPNELCDAIRRVHSGEILVPKALLEQPDAPARANEAIIETETIGELGEQQTKVLGLMTKGFTNPEIARHLNISNPTARYHVSAILRKLDVSNRSEAVALAIRHNLVNHLDF